MGLAPSAPNTTWTPYNKSQLISSKYCELLLPESFEGGLALSLAELIDIGLQNNPSTKITWAEARSSAALYGQSLSAYYPNVSFSGYYQRTFQSFFAVNSTVPYYLTTINPELTLTYTVFDFGQRRDTSEAARQTLLYADWTHNQEIQSVIQTVMDDYYNYVYQKQQLLAYEANLENASATLDAAEQKLKFGVGNLGDVAQAKTAYLQAKINFVSGERNVENALAALLNDIGLPANLHPKIQGLPEKICSDIILDSINDLIEEAQKKRQDLLAAQAQVKSQEANLALAKDVQKPTVQGEFMAGRSWFSSDLPPANNWTLQFTLSFPIFQGWYFKNGVRNAQANLDQASATLLQTELEVIKDVTTSYQNVTTSSQTLKFSEEYVEAAKLEYDIALESYKAGTKTILDVLSAMSSLADARSKLASSKKDWFSSLAGLAYATGALCPAPSYDRNQGCLQ